ncbi:hypothetical protein BGX28_001642, partial [Mortierella sp. GBA30]
MVVRGLQPKFKDALGTEAPDMRGKTTHVDSAGAFYYLVQPRAYSIFAANIQRKVHALGFHVSRRWSTQKIFIKDVKKEFPDQSAVEAKLSHNWADTT